jgi:hypothetical protein
MVMKGVTAAEHSIGHASSLCERVSAVSGNMADLGWV